MTYCDFFSNILIQLCSFFKFNFIIIINLFFTTCGTRDQNCAPCIGSMESKTAGPPGKSHWVSLFLQLPVIPL